MEKRWNRALVTGASSGIGRELARLLAEDHTDLVVVARDAARLEALADELDAEVEVLTADLADPAQLASVEARLRDDERPIDLLVNNAGYGGGHSFVDTDLEYEMGVVQVNIVALMRLTHVAGATMAERGRGGILNVSSLAGDLVAPESAVYSATKAFVTSFTESIHQELAPRGVTVTALCPGLTHTEFHARADFDTTGLPEFMWQDAVDVAREGIEALNAGKPRVTTGALNKTAAGLAGTVPTSLMRMAGRLQMGRRQPAE
ncbi:MAG: SDR family NAD(P)-dependent oxidoreductase [Acidimicrobiales bacterium]